MKTYQKNKIIADALLDELSQRIDYLRPIVNSRFTREFADEYFYKDILDMSETCQYAYYLQLVAESKFEYDRLVNIYNHLTSL